MPIWLFLLLATLVSAPRADLVESTWPGQAPARAEYRAGSPDKPAVLLLHGFLQTHEFPVIHRLTESLNSAGHTVLAPTLTLGIPLRKRSLACEALHTHSQADAIAELDAWLGWLKGKGVRSVVLLGHSFGSMQSLAYAATRPNPMVKGLIGISIIEGRLSGGRMPAKTLADDQGFVTQPFSFCKKYRAPQASLASYLAWSPERVLREVGRLRVPATFIMGGKDERLGPDWIGQLQRTRATVRIIAGADHFMDGEYEFDLLDMVLEELGDKRP
ncbi:MAG: alpha/beta fold hydrolase [Pseudomonadota bacterium]